MPSHPTDLPLIPIIKTKNHPTHKVILLWDFNRDILLFGRQHDDIPQTPNQEDKDWGRFIQGLALDPIHNNETFSWQGGQNYTSTSHSDGFYTNIPFHTLLKCQTLTNQIQNSNYYPVNLTPNSTQLVQKSHQLPEYQPKITYPIPQENIQKLLIKFQKATNLGSQLLTIALQNPSMTSTE